MGEKVLVRKAETSAPIWQRVLLVLCISSMMMFSLFLVFDIESAIKWTGLSNLSETTVQYPVPGSHKSRIHAPILKDDESCLSRTQHLLYRRDSKVLPPSPALDEAWKRYRELHRSCSHGKNWTDHFLNGGQKTDPCNYLIFVEGGAGLGNKILALVSAFTYAFVTDRVLLIDSRKNLPSMLCEPFPGSSWILPDSFPYDQIESSPSLGAAIDKKFENFDVVNIHLEHIQGWGDQQFFCDDRHYSLMKVRWVAWTSTQYYATSMLALPSFWHRLDSLFPSKTDIFPRLARLIILPANHIWARVLRVYWGYLSCSGSRVGIQIRLHGRWDLAAFDAPVSARIRDCLTSHNLLPTTAVEENATQLSGLYSKHYHSEQDGKAVDIAVLIASLQIKYFEEMKELHSRYPSVDGRLVRVHMVSHGGREENTLEQAESALAEMWLLSFSDHLATSAYSTFGYVAQGLGGLRPYILNIRGENISNDGLPSCHIGQSIEPCTHFPQSPICEGSKPTPEHQAWLDKHMQPCQDQQSGLQLIYSDPAETLPT
ncbi:hypothetical protein O6H91_15G052000 [Diphasiastrum complanatum]|uniref:Uncharacterized protein n=2 Tax=Diphasiastrum complanatum TaxID=34168 RepID=A0ACC2BI90_DIPCM|nr:hypothetical protein O6H91_15G051300 [Diphasiastrum complanatum]KAJ7529473.1 hypothetical protein O6H91_15G052000 [Diphasiastrum complanatum]